MNAEQAVIDILKHGYTLGLTTLKACVLEPDRKGLEGTIERLKSQGAIAEVKKDRFRIIEH